jgi:hypothetical protein
MELVDANFNIRGFFSAYGIFVSACILFIVLYFPINLAWDLISNPDYPNKEGALISVIMFPIVFGLGGGGALFWAMKASAEWFGYTHYPIRLNRKTRTVYVYRDKGTYLEVPWDSTFFAVRTIKQVGPLSFYGIAGLVLKDPATVQDWFIFGYSSGAKEYVYRYWEFVRRYMEDGPQAVADADGMRFYLPIADKREPILQAWTGIRGNDGWNPLYKWIMTPFHILQFIGRMFNRLVSKVPLWPEEVEAACRIEPNDPWERDSRRNPEGYR